MRPRPPGKARGASLPRDDRDRRQLTSFRYKNSFILADMRDLQYLEQRGIDVDSVARIFFAFPADWICPVCDASKYSILQRRANGGWTSNIEEHHYGGPSPSKVQDDLYDHEQEMRYQRESWTIDICYLCNGTERDMRAAGLATRPMSPDEMRASEEFRVKRSKKVVRNTFDQSKYDKKRAEEEARAAERRLYWEKKK